MLGYPAIAILPAPPAQYRARCPVRELGEDSAVKRRAARYARVLQIKSRIDIGIAEDEAGAGRVDLGVDRDDSLSLTDNAGGVLTGWDVMNIDGSYRVSLHV